MPEATTLYVMTAIVAAGLVAWVAYVLATVKTPWARGPLEPASPLAGLPMTEYRGATPAVATVESESAMTTGAHLPLAEIDPSVDADETARATPVALSEGKARAAKPD